MLPRFVADHKKNELLDGRNPNPSKNKNQRRKQAGARKKDRKLVTQNSEIMLDATPLFEEMGNN